MKSLLLALGCLLAAFFPTASIAGGNEKIEVASLCIGPQIENEIIAERTLADGSIMIYRRNDADFARLVNDYRVMMRDNGVPDEIAAKDPYWTVAQAKATACGGSKDCGTKTCTKGSCKMAYTGGMS